MFAVHLLVIVLLMAIGAWSIFKGITFAEPTTRRDGTTRQGDPNGWKFRMGALAIPLAFIYMIAIPPSFGQIETAERGVVLRFGSPTGEVLGEGLYFVPPFISSVAVMDVQTHAYVAQKLEAASNDLQSVHTDVTINYNVNPGKVLDLYRAYRYEFGARVMAPAVQEAVKASTARYHAEELIQKRELVKATIVELLKGRLEPEGVFLSAVSITDFAFSPDFEKAIEQKSVAAQNVEVEKNTLAKIQIVQQQKVTEAQANAEAAIAKANGEAKAKVAQGTADAEVTRLTAQANADAIALQADALAKNSRLVDYEMAKKWDGKCPSNPINSPCGPGAVGAGGSVNFQNLPTRP